MIRNLSVFVSHLETIAQPGNANYALFQRASQVFTKILDEILDPQIHIPLNELDDLEFFNCDQVIDRNGLELLNNMEFGVSFDQWLI